MGAFDKAGRVDTIRIFLKDVYPTAENMYLSDHMYQAVHPHDGPGPMDKPCRNNSFAGHMEGQIIGRACGSVGAPL